MEENKSENQQVLPLIPLRDGLVFPSTENVLMFGREKSVKAVRSAFAGDKRVVLLLQKSAKVDNPTLEDLYSVGVVAVVYKILENERGEVSAVVRGEKRVKIHSIMTEGAIDQAIVSEIPEIFIENDESQALVRHINNELKTAINLGKGIDVVFLMNIMSGVTATTFSDQVAMILDLKPDERQGLLEIDDVTNRLRKEADFVSREVKILEIERNIHNKTQKKFEKGIKESVLREKMKTIEQELGGEGEESDNKELEMKLKKAKLPERVWEKALKELKRLQQMSQYNPESSYVRTYLELLSELPWNKFSKVDVDIKKANTILEEDHYGLNKIKERILEYLAVMKLRGSNGSEKLSQSKSTQKGKKHEKMVKPPSILCFVGPPGVGKTSLGRSIARALGREFVKISLGGIKDEAEIRGHRRTYVGALPGRIIQGIKQAGTSNPVFMLDEIDKVGHDYRGDPSAALLEALDPEQNSDFSDHYLEVSYDLSDVVFITTANMLDTIPQALRDRLEIITFSGYTEDEKFNIATRYLAKKQIKAHGLSEKRISWDESGIRYIIHRFTREAGVRELERQIATVLRKIAKQTVEGEVDKIIIKEKDVRKLLGPEKYSSQMIEDKNTIGITTGLAWTPVGGDILFIEVTIMPGKGSLTLTGQLGDVMKESAQAALSYVRSHYEELGLKENFYANKEIHIHVPEGAVPKDGPSAGLAICTALVSALTKIPVDRQVAMTGEITLRGRAMEIGGVKEKVIAAHRAGIKTIILPADNEKDLEELPPYVKADLKFVFVKRVDEVLNTALVLGSREAFKIV